MRQYRCSENIMGVHNLAFTQGKVYKETEHDGYLINDQGRPVPALYIYPHSFDPIPESAGEVLEVGSLSEKTAETKTGILTAEEARQITRESIGVEMFLTQISNLVRSSAEEGYDWVVINKGASFGTISKVQSNKLFSKGILKEVAKYLNKLQYKVTTDNDSLTIEW